MLCPGCFHEKPDAAVCPYCGYDESLKRSPLVLSHHTRLYQNRYQVGRVLGKPGGFGITYLGWDERLQTKVAIKEYLPRELAGRDADHLTVAAHSGEDADAFVFGLGMFLEEARTLAKLDHPNLVRVRDFFEENGTAYLVMDYYDGLTLAEYLARQPGGRIPEAQAIGILLPILDGLREVHGKGFLHRDIKPANIYLTAGNRPILLDFGAARQAIGEHSRSLSVVLSEGYAPIEQYQRNGKQGPWTDVYGAAATLYTMVTGQVPPAATDRLSEETLPGLEGLSPRVTQALRQGLAVQSARRASSIEVWQRVLLVESKTETKAQVEPWLRPVLQDVTSVEPGGMPRYKRFRAVALLWLILGVMTWAYQIEKSLRSLNPFAGIEDLESMQFPSDPGNPFDGIEYAEPEKYSSGHAITAGDVGPSTAITDFACPATACEVCPEMVRLPGGSFLMGSPESEPGRDSDERQHRVTVSAFAIGKYEVTQAEWRAVMGNNPSDFAGCDRCPVEQVSWNDVQQYLGKLNARTGQRYRLPTEAEWEYACRAWGSETFCGADSPDPVAWYYDNWGGKTHTVGQKLANRFGLHDMTGNVWEWTCSAYTERYDGEERTCTNDASSRRVLRGGSWLDRTDLVRSAYRGRLDPTDRNNLLGFRLAQD